MTEPVRIDAREARSRMTSPNPPLFVMAYEDDSKFKLFGLEGAVPFSQLRLDSLPKDREILLYCA